MITHAHVTVTFVASNAPEDATYQTDKSFIGQDDLTMQGMLSQDKTALSILGDPDIAGRTPTHS